MVSLLVWTHTKANNPERHTMETITLTFIDTNTDIDALLAPYTQLTTIAEVATAEDRVYTELSTEFMDVVTAQIVELSNGVVNVQIVSKWLARYSLAAFYGFNSTGNGFWGVAEAANLSDADIDAVMATHTTYMTKWEAKSANIQFNQCKTPDLYDRYIMSL